MVLASRRGALLGISLALMACFVTTASADITYEKSIGGAGTAAGQFSVPAGVAINNSTGDVYVVDRGNNRIQQFTSGGAFARMWGYDVVQEGEDNKPLVNEVSEVRIRATSGSFSLTFGGAETAQIPFDAPAGSVQSALNGLPTVSTGGGAVTVAGGPGNANGSAPYIVTFVGAPGSPTFRTNVELGIDTSGLGRPPGTQLTCEGTATGADSYAYRWLADGEPVTGATSTTFVPGEAEQGKAIQCEVTAGLGLARTMATSRPYVLTSPAPTTLPPIGPTTLASPTGAAILESVGGVPLTCNAGTWSRSPATFTYQWYRNGQTIGAPTTTAATTDEYLLTQADLASRAVFQCAVTGHNAGGSSTTISQFLATEPKPIEPSPANATAAVTVANASASKVITRTNGGSQFEVCKANPPSNDVCKAGVSGNGLGQLGTPRSIAVDNSPGGGGAVYVMDDSNPRVQKFSSGGNPLLIIGGGVNQTTDGDVCTVNSGDACGKGIADKSGGPGERIAVPGSFGGAPLGGNFTELGNELAVDPAGNLYVGDPRGNGDFTQPRIQKFDSAGGFLSQVKIPFVFANPSATVRPISIAADSAQRAFASTPGEQAAVEKFAATEFTPSGDEGRRPGNLFHSVGDPVQLALDPRNDRLLISDPNLSTAFSICGGPAISGRAIVEYDSDQQQIDCSVPTGPGALPQVTGMAVSGAGLLYAAVGSQNTVKIFALPVSTAPQIGGQSVTGITTATAVVHGQVNPGFENTIYKVEYGLAPCGGNSCETAPGGVLRGLKPLDGPTAIKGLQPDTTYHYRVVAENALGTDEGDDRTFRTFPLVDLVNDSCPNALARKQTKTVGLLDCRGYELVSAAFAGGYDVQSNLVPGQTPFDGYPDADAAVLYGVKDGGIPNTGNPTNRGLDPYLATRDADGWSTEYAGIPADNQFAAAPFSSTLAGAAAGLETLAFGGPEICAPCFADGSSGIPVRFSSGALTQGMTGSIPHPAAKASGYVAKSLSADGKHLIFGSTAEFEAAADEGEPAIFERDLGAGVTTVVSTLPNADPMTGDVGALDVASDGSRVVVGQRIATDGQGNSFWNLYLHRTGSSGSVPLAPGTVAGVLYGGMTSDGGRLFFVTIDELLPADADESADLYEAAVDSAGTLTLNLLSKGATPPIGNSDSCDPAPNADGNNWNAVGGSSPNSCGVVALAGGAGVAESDGTAYFLSPESLDGAGVQDQPNLFVVRPGSSPHLVATLEPGNPLVRNAVKDSEVHSYGDFQVTPDGHFAAFASSLPLKVGYDNAGRYEVYRYDTVADALACVSCNPTEGQPSSDASLPPNGLGLLLDGRVFFNSGEQLTLRDTNGKLDAYEWKAGAQQLISAGNSAFPSGMLGASSDGTDAFFFTRDVLVEGDRNGQAMKIYTAREGGGFFVIPPPPLCAASDECHGPGTQPAPSPPIGSFEGTGGQFSERPKPKCRKGFVRRGGKCVRKKKNRGHPTKKTKKTTRRSGGGPR